MDYTVKSCRNTAGFTFLELSIVILVIGMIIGGVMAGQALLKSSQLRTILTEAKNFSQSVMTFKSKYQSLPGDMPDAISLWGAANNNPATCPLHTGAGKETCNGDGNGLISTANVTDFGERTRFWEHMQNADIIPGKLSGRAWADARAKFDDNMPRSSYDQAGWTVTHFGWGNNDLIFDRANAGKHVFVFGAELQNEWNMTPIITAQDAWALDNKMDNGMPGSGKLLVNRSNAASFYPTTPNCSTTDVQTTAEYNMTVAGKNCVLFFVAEF